MFVLTAFFKYLVQECLYVTLAEAEYLLPGALAGDSGGEPGRRPEWERSLYSWGGTGQDTAEKKKNQERQRESTRETE